MDNQHASINRRNHVTLTNRLRFARVIAKIILDAASRPIRDADGIRGYEFSLPSRKLLIYVSDTRKSQRPAYEVVVDEVGIH